MIKFEGLFLVIVIALQIYALFDCARTSQEAVRSLPKWGWLVIVIIFGVIGSVAWLIAGKPKNAGGSTRRRPKGIIPPDDDPDFLRNL